MERLITLACGLVAAALATPATACPICNSGTGDQVRAGLTDGNLGAGALAVLAPFVVLSGVTAAIHLGFPQSRGDDEHDVNE